MQSGRETDRELTSCSDLLQKRMIVFETFLLTLTDSLSSKLDTFSSLDTDIDIRHRQTHAYTYIYAYEYSRRDSRTLP